MILKAPEDVHAAAAAAECVVKVHFALVEYLRAGQTLAEIDSFVASTLRQLDCRSAFLRYKIRGHPPYPSHACISVNDCIVHGTHVMTTRPIEPGDLVSIDIGVRHQGWIGDAAWTYSIESASDEAMHLMRTGRESLRIGIETMQPGRPLNDWAVAVQDFVEGDRRLHLARGLGGHGYGRQLHGPPFVSNVVIRSLSGWPDANKPFEAGMLLAVEPMIAIGTGEIRGEHRQWPIFTADGSLSVHYEADVLITEDGPRNLTKGLDDLPNIVG